MSLLVTPPQVVHNLTSWLAVSCLLYISRMLSRLCNRPCLAPGVLVSSAATMFLLVWRWAPKACGHSPWKNGSSRTIASAWISCSGIHRSGTILGGNPSIGLFVWGASLTDLSTSKQSRGSPGHNPVRGLVGAVLRRSTA